MREPLAMKQAHKNVVYKRNRAERSLISKINKGRDWRAMSNEAIRNPWAPSALSSLCLFDNRLTVPKAK